MSDSQCLAFKSVVLLRIGPGKERRGTTSFPALFPEGGRRGGGDGGKVGIPVPHSFLETPILEGQRSQCGPGAMKYCN